MRECNQCHNGIPDDVAECPHCYSLTLGQILLQELFGLVLIAAVLIAGYFFYTQEGIGLGSKILVALLFGVPLILWGLFTLKKSIKQTLAAPYMKRYKNHTDHIFAVSCFCAFCGKFEGHDFEGCKCRRCGETRNESHSWDGCKCQMCGAVQHEWVLVSTEEREERIEEFPTSGCADCPHRALGVEDSGLCHPEMDEHRCYHNTVVTLIRYKCTRCGSTKQDRR